MKKLFFFIPCMISCLAMNRTKDKNDSKDPFLKECIAHLLLKNQKDTSTSNTLKDKDIKHSARQTLIEIEEDLPSPKRTRIV